MYEHETEAFAQLAQGYCRWAEGEPGLPAEEAMAARHWLARLYAAALALPELPPQAAQLLDRVPEGEYRRIHRRFAPLPLKYYHETFDPLALEEPSVSLGDLGDDLADIYGDLKRGVEAWGRGERQDAVYEWRRRFIQHWGEHAASALRALHWHLRQG